jgi:hypothetical protein
VLFGGRNKNELGLRVIKTARDQDSINRAARSGLRPLVKKVEPSDEIRSKFAVVQFKLHLPAATKTASPEGKAAEKSNCHQSLRQRTGSP